MLKDLIARQLETGLADFTGLHVEGSVPIKQELINQIIAEVLANGLGGSSSSESSEDTAEIPAPSAPAPTPSRKPGGTKLDRASLQKLVQQLVKRAEITAENGAITLHFEVER